MTYRARYYTTLQPLAVLDVLMADESNPRSLDFQLTHLVDLYQRLPRHLPDDLQAMRDALRSPARLRSWQDQLSAAGRRRTEQSRAAGLVQLESFLSGLERLLPSWSDNLSSRYFSHARTLPISIGL